MTYRSISTVCRTLSEISNSPRLLAEKKEQFSRVLIYRQLGEITTCKIVPRLTEPEPDYTHIFYIRILPNRTLHGKQSYRCTDGDETISHYDTGRRHGVRQVWYKDKLQSAVNYVDGFLHGTSIRHNTYDPSRPEYIIEEYHQGIGCPNKSSLHRGETTIVKIPKIEKLALATMFDFVM